MREPPSAHRTIEELAREIWSRLLRDGDEAAVPDPIDYLDRVASQIESEWGQTVLHRALEDPPDVLRSMRSAFDSLAGPERYVMWLHLRQGLTYKEIASRLRIVDCVVLRSLTRAYARLIADED